MSKIIEIKKIKEMQDRASYILNNLNPPTAYGSGTVNMQNLEYYVSNVCNAVVTLKSILDEVHIRLMQIENREEYLVEHLSGVK